MPWSEAVKIPGQTSRAAPALAVFPVDGAPALHLVHLGEASNDLWHSWTLDGTAWSADVKIPGHASRATPALAVLGSELHLVHLGETSTDLWHGRSEDGRTWTRNARLPDQRSRTTPALAAFGGALHLVHLGEASTALWHSRLTLTP